MWKKKKETKEDGQFDDGDENGCAGRLRHDGGEEEEKNKNKNFKLTLEKTGTDDGFSVRMSQDGGSLVGEKKITKWLLKQKKMMETRLMKKEGGKRKEFFYGRPSGAE